MKNERKKIRKLVFQYTVLLLQNGRNLHWKVIETVCTYYFPQTKERQFYCPLIGGDTLFLFVEFAFRRCHFSVTSKFSSPRSIFSDVSECSFVQFFAVKFSLWSKCCNKSTFYYLKTKLGATKLLF